MMLKMEGASDVFAEKSIFHFLMINITIYPKVLDMKTNYGRNSKKKSIHIPKYLQFVPLSNIPNPI